MSSHDSAWQSTKGLLWMMVVALNAFVNAHASDSSGSLARPLPILSASALARSVANGQVIRGRRVLGEDLAKLLKVSSKETKCNSRAAIKIDSSVIVGNVNVQDSLPRDWTRPSAGDSDEEQAANSPGLKTERYQVPLTISIRNTSFTGDTFVIGVNFLCMLDISKSTFEGQFQATGAAISHLLADGSKFRREANFQSTQWKGAASFRGAQFSRSAEFSHLQRGIPGGGEFKDVDFEEAIFHRYAAFMRVKFSKTTNFHFARFADESNFSQSSIGPGPKGSFRGPFYQTEFAARVSFRNARFESIRFNHTAFLGALELDEVRASSLQFVLVGFRGPVDFTRARIKSLVFLGLMTATQEVSFRYATLEHLRMTRMTFEKNVDFGGTCLHGEFSMIRVAFKADVRFDDARLPPQPTDDCRSVEAKPNFSMREVSFEKGLFLSEKQFLASASWWDAWSESQPLLSAGARRPPSADRDDDDDGATRSSPQIRRQWREFERGFQNAGNLSLQNYALYRRTVMENADKKQTDWLLDRADRYFWGYGLRPMRMVVWLCVVALFFACIYVTQTSALAQAQPRVPGWWRRIRFALGFSIKTMLRPKYGYENSSTSVFKVITGIQWIFTAALLTCLLYSLSKANPLVNELIKKIIV